MPRGTPTKPLVIRLTADELAAYETAANEAELTLSEWARKRLSAAAHAPARPDRQRLRLEATIEGLEQDARRMVERARKARG